MTKTRMTSEQLMGRWESRREIQNLMGIYSYHFLMKREGSIFEDLWSASGDVCLGTNAGFYVGREAVAGYYDALEEEIKLKTLLLRKAFPEKLGNKSAEELHGVGSVDYRPLYSDLIEVAGDGETAKGMWISYGSHDRLTAGGPLAYWTWGFYAADFILEYGQWRFWHLQYLEDVCTPCSDHWGRPEKERPPVPEFSEMHGVTPPVPTVPAQLREHYYDRRRIRPTPPPPVAYGTFSETFSYGYQQ